MASNSKNIAELLNGDTSITTLDVANGSITTDKLADGAVSTAKLSDGEVTPAKLSDTLDLSTKTMTLPTGVGGPDWTTAVQTSDFTAENSKGYWVDTTSNTVTVTLPSSPSQGDYVIIKDYAGTANTNNILIVSNDEDIQGNTGTWDHTISADDASVELRYINSTRGWVAVASANEGSTKTISSVQPTYTIGYYIVSGGGSGTVGGGYEAGAGGGAGGRLSSTLTFGETNVYTIEVGAGASHGGRAAGQSGSSGSQSKIKLGATTLVAPVGGGGTTHANNGSSGGSGGGGAAGNGGRSGGSGTSGQGNSGGNGVSGNSGQAGGGGGITGGGGTSNGGAGESNDWETGSNQTYGGGGGGSHSGSGGSGVGGNGINSESTAAGNGATNTGSGGGGRHSPDQYPSAATGGHGGSGVCIIRIPNANYSGTTTGSPVVRTDSTYTYLTYKQNGTYTA